MREYLSDLEPEEVIDRLNNGERVYYIDSKGNKYFYKVYKGMTIRYNEDGEVDGYNRSIYSTGEAFFEVFNEATPFTNAFDEDQIKDPDTEKFDKYLKLIIKALKEGLDK